MSSVRKSIIIVLVERYLTLIISFVGAMLLARVLTPMEIGIYSVAAAATGIAQMLRDFGVGSYIIQEKELTKDRLRTAMTITLFTSWLAAALLFISREWIADFYDEQALALLIEIQCINFLIIPFTAPILSLLRREMQFAVLFRTGLICSIAQLVTTLSLAVSGYGYLSLAWGGVANSVCLMMLINANRPSDAWLLPGLSEWRKITSFGAKVSLTSIITEIAMSMNDLVIGRFLGFNAVAIYSRAQGLMYLFHRDIMGAVRKVAFPVFAKAVREEKNLAEAYLLSVNYITVFSWPFYAFLGLFAPQIIRLLFGDQWDEAIPLVRIIVYAGAIASLWSMASSALMSLGQVNEILKSELIVQSIRIVLVLYAGSISIEMVCYALVVTYIVQLIVMSRLINKSISVRLSELIIKNYNSLFVSAFSMIFPVFVYFYILEELGDMEIVLVSGSGFILGWVLGVFAMRHPIYSEILRLIKRNN